MEVLRPAVPQAEVVHPEVLIRLVVFIRDSFLAHQVAQEQDRLERILPVDHLLVLVQRVGQHPDRRAQVEPVEIRQVLVLLVVLPVLAEVAAQAEMVVRPEAAAL